jgi:hypothetical protein
VTLLKVHQKSLLAHLVRSTYFWLCHIAILEVLGGDFIAKALSL